jgi:hypothetical protein
MIRPVDVEADVAKSTAMGATPLVGVALIVGNGNPETTSAGRAVPAVWGKAELAAKADWAVIDEISSRTAPAISAWARAGNLGGGLSLNLNMLSAPGFRKYFLPGHAVRAALRHARD